MSIINTPFAHRVNGKWYFSSHASPRATTLEAYKEQVREAYGNLRGVKFAVQGQDFEHFDNTSGVITLVPAPTEGTFEIYGKRERCRILVRRNGGANDVERLSDGCCFRVSGLSL